MQLAVRSSRRSGTVSALRSTAEATGPECFRRSKEVCGRGSVLGRQDLNLRPIACKTQGPGRHACTPGRRGSSERNCYRRSLTECLPVGLVLAARVALPRGAAPGPSRPALERCQGPGGQGSGAGGLAQQPRSGGWPGRLRGACTVAPLCACQPGAAGPTVCRVRGPARWSVPARPGSGRMPAHRPWGSPLAGRCTGPRGDHRSPLPIRSRSTDTRGGNGDELPSVYVGADRG